jgi:flagellar M-ring protein FliF
MAAARADAVRFLRSQPPARLVPWAVAALFAAGLVTATVAWSRHAGYALLYADLELAESAKVVDHLDKTKLRYRIEDGGHSILVPRADVALARMQLAEKGITRASIPVDELTAKITPGMSVAAQQMMRQHVLQRELAESVMTLAGVQSARVHLSPAEASVFADERRPAKASVLVDLRPGLTDRPFRADGIAFLVANAVEGLRAEDVSIMDSTGRLMWPLAGDPMAEGQGSVAELRRSLETAVAEKAVALLAPVVGRENVRVEAAVELDADTWERSEETFSPDPVIRSEQVVAGDGGERTVNYEVGRTVERRHATSARVRRFSLAVFVNEPQGAARDEAELRRFEAILRDAVGYDEVRGDRITVASAVFQATPAAEPAPPPEPPGSALHAVANLDPLLLGGAAAAVVALLALAFVGGRKLGGAATMQRIEREAPRFSHRQSTTAASSALRQWVKADPERVAQLLKAVGESKAS